MAGLDPRKADRIRLLCQRLKPMIGSQAERIWLAYVAENDDGRDKIEEYLELLAAQHFHGNLDAQGPGLLPPGSETADGEYKLGDVVYNGKSLYPFGLRESEWTQHVGVFGRSGAGKTNLGFLIVQELVRSGKPVLIFDWKRNYRDLLAMPIFQHMAVCTTGRPVSPLSFNPLIPPPQTNPQTWLKKIIAVIAHAYLLGDGVIYLLQEAIDRVYKEAGVYTGHIDHWPTFRDVLAQLKQRPSSGREAGWMSSALRALSSLCFGEMDAMLNSRKEAVDLRPLLTQPVILELDALTQSDKVFVVQSILLYIHHLRMAEPTREHFRNSVLIEEAHHVLSGERQSLVGGQSVMDITFREIRELGVGIIACDQHPSQISLPALGNTYCTICFNLKHRTDVNAMSQAMLLKDEDKAILGNLQIGEAVVRLQGRAAGPFMIKVPEFTIHKGSVTDTDVIHHMTRLGLLSVRDQPVLRQPAVLQAPENTAAPDLRPRAVTTESALLQDVERYPDSGIAERYKRLGLSVRQGQKAKNTLVDSGLVVEEVQATRVGKLRVLGLTEQGRLRLSEIADGRNAA
jgi:hypothetical protein